MPTTEAAAFDYARALGVEAFVDALHPSHSTETVRGSPAVELSSRSEESEEQEEEEASFYLCTSPTDTMIQFFDTQGKRTKQCLEGKIKSGGHFCWRCCSCSFTLNVKHSQ